MTAELMLLLSTSLVAIAAINITTEMLLGHHTNAARRLGISVSVLSLILLGVIIKYL